ncbi:toxD [Fusarium albosuccineum]|uniref:ToxD n=1 Tax=Fusarium albosuccineum TaxID=1237068 RepID=A0A8H4P3F3_9HYPO|nr:toxD [Fusarium albosuccineum]
MQITMKAILSLTPGNPSIETVDKPSLSVDDHDTAIVPVKYVGNNPGDWISTTIPELWHPDTIVGCDFSGIVESVGAQEQRLKPGDAVFGVVVAGDATDRSRGAFAEYVPAFVDFLNPFPKGQEEAPLASLGVGLLTVGISIFQDLGLPWPSENGDWDCGNRQWFLVNGASTATGLMLTQWLGLAGFRVIGTAGKHNWDIVKARGVEFVWDYRDMDNCVQQIPTLVCDDLQFVYNCSMDDAGAEVVHSIALHRPR